MKKRIIIALTLLITATLPASAASGTSGGAAPVLRFGTGARAFAMGGAYIAIVNDSSAVYWNPAGLAELSATELTTMHSALFEGTNYDYIGWAMPLNSGGFGINLINLSTPGILNTEGSETDASTRVLYFGYGQTTGSWSYGATVKYIQEDILGSTGSGWGLDLGTQLSFNDRWRLGIMLQDVVGTEISWSTGYSEDVPLNTRVGLSYTNQHFLLVYEVEKALDFIQHHIGFEFNVNDFLRLRAGMRGSDFATGIGIIKEQWSFDYAYCAGDLGNTHRLSFGVKFK